MRNAGRPSRWKDLLLIARNTAFWISLGVILLSSPTRLVVGGSLLALLMGAGIVYLSLRRDMWGPGKHGCARILSLVMGTGALGGGFAGLAWSLSNGITIAQLLELPAFGGIRLNPFDVVYASVVALAFVLAFGLDRWLRQRETALGERYEEIGQVYPIPPFARVQTLFALSLNLLVDAFLLLSALNGARTGFDLGAGLSVPLVLAPATLFGLYNLVHNGGMVVLTSEAVILRRLGRERRLPYRDIVDVEEHGLGLPPNLVLKGQHTTLGINRQVKDLPTLRAVILQRMTTARRAAETGNASSP